MLLYTHKLERYIIHRVLPKILLNSKKFLIKGSFKRKVPYVTDIDIVNNVYPEIDKSNIYQKLTDLIGSVKDQPDIILAQITCGVDDRFKLESASEDNINLIRPLLTIKELNMIDLIISKYKDDLDRRLFYVNELIWPLYKLRWSPSEVLNNKKILRGDLVVQFDETLQKNSTVLLQYFVDLGKYPIGFDVLIMYEKIKLSKSYESASDYQLKLSNYGREYYYMLFPLKRYFKDQKIIDALDELIEKKFGLYKQLMIRIEAYKMLFDTNNLNIKRATAIVTSILKDLVNLPGFKSDVPDLIRKVATNNAPEIKIKEWSILLDKLYIDIGSAVNMAAKDHFFKYLEMVPSDQRDKVYLKMDEQQRIARIK
jgi:hypothetical protein